MKGFIFILLFLTSLPSFAVRYIVFHENGKAGIKNDAGEVVIPPSFEALGWSDGSFSVIGEVTGYRVNQKWGIINLKKEFVTKAEYETLSSAGGDCLVARKKLSAVLSKTGCINLQGEVKIPFIYDGVEVQGLRAIVFNLNNGHFIYGLNDLQNHVLIPMKYKNIRSLGTLRYAIENDDNKIALFSDDGKPVTDFKIDSISDFYKNFAIIHQNLKQGLIDREGAIKLEPIYTAIKITEEGKVLALLPSQWLFINSKNETVNTIFADDLKLLTDDSFIIQTGGKKGIIDKDLKPILVVQYDNLLELANKTIRASKHGKYGVIRYNSKEIIPFRYDSLSWSDNSFRAYIKNEGWTLLDSLGKSKTFKHYNSISSFNGQGFPVINNHYWGELNSKGEEFIHCVFDSLINYSGDLIAVKFKGQYGIINVREDWVVAPQPYPLQLISDSRYLLKQPSNVFIKGLTGEIFYFTPNRMEFKKDYFLEFLPDGTEKTISYNGLTINRVTPSVENIQRIFPVSEGYRGIKKDGKFGYVDAKGRLVIANRYDSIGEFHEGLGAVKLIGKWGFVNTSDKVAINPNYDVPGKFKNGIAIVVRNKKAGLIGKEGKIILPLRYDAIERLSNQHFLISMTGLKGLADEKGNVQIEPRFDYLQQIDNGFVITGRVGRYGVITTQGLSVIPSIYDQLTYDRKRNQFFALKRSEWKEMEIK